MIDLHERQREDVAASALGSLDEPARSRTEAHLRGCEACRLLLAEYWAAAALLPRALPVQEPSPAIRERLLARIHDQPHLQQPAAYAAAAAAPPAASYYQAAASRSARRRFWPALAGLAAAALAALVVGVGLERRSGKQTTRIPVNQTRDQTVIAVSPVAPTPSLGRSTLAVTSVRVQPSSGQSSDAFSFTADGYAPFQRVDVFFVAPSGERIIWLNPTTGGSETVADAQGRFGVAFIPATGRVAVADGQWQAHFQPVLGPAQLVSFTVQH